MFTSLPFFASLFRAVEKERKKVMAEGHDVAGETIGLFFSDILVKNSLFLPIFASSSPTVNPFELGRLTWKGHLHLKSKHCYLCAKIQTYSL